MGDGIVVTKTTVSDFSYLYGKEAKDFTLTLDERVQMHAEQLEAAKELHSKLYDEMMDMRTQLIKVNDAINWNTSMLKKLKGK